MAEFQIDIENQADEPDAPVGIGISAGDIVFTELLREGANAPDNSLKAPPGPLAFWLVDNWWRLRTECVPSTGPNAEWRLRHDVSSLGGYAWPRLSIWGEGDRIGLASRSDPPGIVGPVRYLTDALTFVGAADFESAVDAFLKDAAGERPVLLSDRAALQARISDLMAERGDPDTAAWRRLEAQLGYDVDEAPDAVMTALAVFQDKYGAGAVAEAALATQGDRAAQILENEIVAANDHHWQCDLLQAAKLAGTVKKGGSEPPWQLGEAAAGVLRKAVGHPTGPLSNSDLADVLSVRRNALYSVQGAAPRELIYGLRLNTGRKRGEVVALASRWGADRRFEFCRALGDAVWSKNEKLGPITRAKSERQKFQRAFSQSLLCPYDSLVDYIGQDVSDGALTAAAKHFQVSERLVRSVLVNKRKLERHRLLDLNVAHGFEAAASDFDEVLEAA